MSTSNICFCREIRKVCEYPLLSGPMILMSDHTVYLGDGIQMVDFLPLFKRVTLM